MKYKSTDGITCIEYNKLKNIANKINWEKIYEFQDPNLATDFLINSIQECIEKSKFIKKKVNNCKKVWMTDTIRQLWEKKEESYLAWKDKKPKSKVAEKNIKIMLKN